MKIVRKTIFHNIKKNSNGKMIQIIDLSIERFEFENSKTDTADQEMRKALTMKI